jgi:lipopolysaccharide export system protein LptA
MIRVARIGTGTILALLLAAAPAVAAPAPAPAAKGVPNAVAGFATNRNEPVQIDAASLEVRDKDKVATFSGNVRVVQGDTTMRCQSLMVFYEGGDKAAPGAMKAATPGPGGQQSISRLEAKGGVVVTQKDQTATGDTGLFDMRKNTITLLGNVVVSQGTNVLRGERLLVDMTTGVSRVDSGGNGKSKGRVEMLIQQTGKDNPMSGAKPVFPGR